MRRARIHVMRRWLFPAVLVYVVLGFAAATRYPALLGAVGLGEFAALAALEWLPRKYDDEARATADGLWIGDRLVVTRKSIQSAHLRSRRNTTWLRIQRRSGWVDVALDTPGEERSWLSALRMDAAGVVWRQVVRADRSASRAARSRSLLIFVMPIAGMVALSVALGVLLGTGHPHAIGGVMLAGVIMSAVQLFALGRTMERVTIGADGLTLRRWIGRARFVPFAAVADFRMEGRDIVLALGHGDEVAWHMPSYRTGDILERHRAFVSRINDGLAAHRALAATENAAQLARGTRSVSNWLRDLRASADPDRVAYRIAALPPEALWKTVENATAAPAARAGAAIALKSALGPALNDAERKRLRDVAASCASNDLRAALEAAAADQDVERYLEALAD